MFGTIGIIETIRSDQRVVARGAFASYNPEERALLLQPKLGRMAATAYFLSAPEGWFSTTSPFHGYQHEIGHALHYYCESILPFKERLNLTCELDAYRERMFIYSDEGFNSLSEYAAKNYKEMVAEAIVQIMDGSAGSVAERILLILRGGRNVL